MGPAEVVDKLRIISEDLRACGVLSLRLFGSTAREDRREDSDVDFLVQLREPDYRVYCKVLDLLEAQLGMKVDLVMVEALKPRLRAQILKEALLVA